MKLLEVLKNKKLNNKGAAIALVIVAMAFIGILAALIMFMAYMNYYMKLTNMRATDNFYSAEGVVEQMKTGLQEELSTAAGIAYEDVLQRYADYSESERQSYFDLQVITNLRKAVMDEDATNYSLNNLCSFVNSNGAARAAITGGSTSAVFNITDDAGKNIEVTVTRPAAASMELSANSITLKNVKVEFVDAKGYVSIIETDFKLRAPLLDFSDPQESSDLLEYTVIADKHLECSGISTFEDGNVYAGSGKDTDPLVSGNSLIMGTGSTLTVLASDKFIVGDTLQMNQSSGFTSKELVNLYTKSFSLEGQGATLQLEGTDYVADDLEFNEKGGKAKINGSYYGYGIDTNFMTDSTGGSYGDDSSAILINAKNSELDLSETNVLWLGGRSYVGTRRKKVDGQKENINIPMSESISVRGNQIAYLVPAKALAQINGDPQVTRNPMTAEEYTKFIDSNLGRDNFVECNLDFVPEGMSPLRNYTTGKGYQTVWAQGLGNSTSIVYYYLLMDAAGANQYFADYYGIDKNKVEIDKYLEAYMGGNAIKTNADADATVSIAGNWLSYEKTGDNPTVALNKGAGDTAYVSEASTYANTFKALNVKLVENLGICTEEEIAKGSVYENIIDESVINAHGNSYTFETETGKKALVTKNNVTTSSLGSDYRLIVSEGNITIDSDFTGLAIAKGTVYMNGAGGISVKNDTDSKKDIQDLMACREDADGLYLYDFFIEGSSLASNIETTKEEDADNSLGKLVTYENWYKE